MKLLLVTFGLLLTYNDAFVWMRSGVPGKAGATDARNISKNGPATAEHVNLMKGSDTIRSGSNGEISQLERKRNIGINPGKYQIDDHRPIKVEAERAIGIVSNKRFVRGFNFDVNIGLNPGKGKKGKPGKGRNRRQIVNRLIENGGNPNRVGILNLGTHTACKDGNIRVVDNGNVAGNKEVGNGQKPGNNRVENGQKPGNNRVENGQKPGNNKAENGQKPGNNRVENEQNPRKKEFEDKQECGNRRVENEPKSENKQESGQKPDKNKGGNDQKPCKVGKEHNDKVNESGNKRRNCDVTVKGENSTKVECGVGKASTVVEQNSHKNNTWGARHTRKTVGDPRNPNKVFKPFSR